MTDQQEKIIAALEQGEATPQQQREAARMLRDLEQELREFEEWEERE